MTKHKTQYWGRLTNTSTHHKQYKYRNKVLITILTMEKKANAVHIY